MTSGLVGLSFGWMIGSITLLLVVLYFTRVLHPANASWTTEKCEVCGEEAYLRNRDDMNVCGSCAELLPYNMSRVTAALTGLPFFRSRR